MRAYVIRRLFLIIPTLLVVTIAVFLTVRFIPGNVIDIMISDYAQGGGTVADMEGMRAMLKHRLGLDVPVHIQYLRWMGLWQQEDGQFHGVLQGDLGHSLWG
jgi:peptide/nickel transport system permease protein